MPTVVFKLFENDGTPVAPASFTTSSGSSNLNILMGGPTTDYAINPVRQRADGATFDGTLATFTFTTAIPASADRHLGLLDRSPPRRQLHVSAARGESRPRGCAERRSLREPLGRHARASPPGRRPRALQHLPRPARAPRRSALQHRGMRALPQPQRERRRAAAGRSGSAGVDRFQADDPPDPHRARSSLRTTRSSVSAEPRSTSTTFASPATDATAPPATGRHSASPGRHCRRVGCPRRRRTTGTRRSSRRRPRAWAATTRRPPPLTPSSTRRPSAKPARPATVPTPSSRSTRFTPGSRLRRAGAAPRPCCA